LFDSRVSQEDVFKKCTINIIDGVLDGFNGCVFAFGQTGSGKTHTMSGPPIYNPYNIGLVPRTSAYIFKRVHELSRSAPKTNPNHTPNVAVSVRLSVLEIYNEGLHDLLKASSGEYGDNATVTQAPEWNVNTEVLHDPKLHIVETAEGMHAIECDVM
jgi:kinesin family member 15